MQADKDVHKKAKNLHILINSKIRSCFTFRSPNLS